MSAERTSRPANLAKQIWLQVAGLCVVAAVSAATGLLLDARGLHYHDDGTGLRAHAHLHGGSHLHHGSPTAPDFKEPDPDRREAPDEEAPRGRYVPSAGFGDARVEAIDAVTGSVEVLAAFCPDPVRLPPCRSHDPAPAPRGPPA